MMAHLYYKMRIGQTQICPCDTAPMDTARLLTGLPTPGHPKACSLVRGDPLEGEFVRDCLLQYIPRLAAWPEETPLRENLSGTAYSNSSQGSQLGQRRPP